MEIQTQNVFSDRGDLAQKKRPKKMQNISQKKLELKKLNESLVLEWQRTGSKSALEKLQKINSGLVIDACKKYFIYFEQFEREDIMQHAWIGFMRAIKTFDREKGTLETHIYHSAKWYASNSLKRFNLVKRARGHIVDKTRYNYKKLLKEKMKDYPSMQEAEAKEIILKQLGSNEDILEIAFSIPKVLFESTSFSLGKIPDDRSLEPVSKFESDDQLKYILKKIDEYIDRIDPRHGEVLEKILKLNMSGVEAARAMIPPVSKQRVWQIYKKHIKKLKVFLKREIEELR